MRLNRHHSSVSEQHDGTKAVARVFLLGEESVYPGWYMQRYVKGVLKSTRLDIHEDSQAIDAVVAAASCLNCPIGQIQVSGPAWPLHPRKD